ncbi:MAG: 6-phosphogluconolactonase, partial [Rectinema sp.]|nr:6-phosphogluconolactonase [Rectinema sp.]
PVYRACSENSLFRDTVERKKIHLWVGDEREVPAGSGLRNTEMIEAAFSDLLSKHPESRHGVILHAWLEGPREEASARYAAELMRGRGEESAPFFDIVVLGMGEDGHTAGLFDAREAVRKEGQVILFTHAPTEPTRRMTMSPELLRSAKRIIILIRGMRKLRVLMENLYGDRQDPISLFIVKPQSPVEVFVCLAKV